MTLQYGWTCPKCGRVYAPYIPQCAPCSERASEDETTRQNLRYRIRITALDWEK